MLLSLLLFCASFFPSLFAYAEEKKDALYININMLWNGRPIDKASFSAIKNLRKDMPFIRFNHFIHPSYLMDRNISFLKDAALEDETIGVYLDGEKNFIDKAGVSPKYSPTFWGNILDAKKCKTNCAKDIPLSIYKEDELELIFKYALKLFEDNQIKLPDSFFIAGFISTKKIRKIARSFGMTYDFSPIPKDAISSDLKYSQLYSWLASNWKSLRTFAQPFYETADFKNMILIPSNLGVLENLTKKKVQQVFDEALKAPTDLSATFLSFNIDYQEVFFHELMLKKFVERMSAFAEKEGYDLVFRSDIRRLMPALNNFSMTCKENLGSCVSGFQKSRE